MELAVFGAGYVGCLTSGCLAARGHDVVAIDIVREKVESLNAGKSPVLEPGLDELLRDQVGAGRLHAVTSLDDLPRVDELDVAVICVSTPSGRGGAVDTSAVLAVLGDLAQRAVRRRRPLPVAIRSTIPAPEVRAMIRELGLDDADSWIRIVVNPEFLRETCGIRDFNDPPFIVVGSDDRDAAEVVMSMYEGIDTSRHIVGIETAATVKYACNAYHATKIGFANEIATLASLVGADPVEVMSLVTEDRVLNVSAAYLRPGFAFGGSCLPKDLRALVAIAEAAHEPLPILSAVLPSNQRRIAQALESILELPGKRLGFLGLSFKRGSDDLRESPYVELAEHLLGKGFDIKIFDPDVDVSRVVGSNRAWVDIHLPHLSRLLVDDVRSALTDVDGLVLCKTVASFEEICEAIPVDLPLFDLEYNATRAGLSAHNVRSLVRTLG